MKTATKYAAILFCVLFAACGCESIGEDVVTPGEIAAARDIKVQVSARSLDLKFNPPLVYMRGSRLMIEAMFYNSSRASASTLVYDVYLFDADGERLEYDDIYTRTLPETIFAGSSGTARIDVPAAQVATVVVRVRLSICGMD